ncbi:hypothetical protein [Pseudotenacibaculum haliotis]|uniref:GH64 domain-containing protein n=1 Tax=Pseudotenacibaculum haliotis TaxID=1862138 RepID=A0ABW5LPC2_9FLAO
MTINFYNKTGNTDLYLFFDFAPGGATKAEGFANMEYLQPWALPAPESEILPLSLDKPYTCSFEYLNSGTFWYIITNEAGAKTIKDHPSISMGTADPNWVGGFFELTYLEGQDTYFDVTNVDQVGLLCGVEFLDSKGSKTGTCGYGETANDMISGLISACSLATDTSAKVSLTGTDGNTYTKLWGPTVPEVTSQYKGTYDDYITKITENGTTINIQSDSTKGSPHGGTQLDAFNFTGKFGAPDFDMPTGCPIEKSDVVVWFTSDDCTKKGDTTYIFCTKDAINGGTIMSGNSPSGMYVYPAFEYADPSDQSKIKKGGWANNVSLNWTATGVNAVADTTCFQAMISSVLRDLVTAMNLGYIGISEDTNDFTYKDNSTYASQATQDKYMNEWNNYITSNSDSYGMAYSDGTHAKVQFHPAADGSINCHIFGQDDADTKNYWSKS